MANIPQWKVGDILSASKLNDMVDAINNLLADQTGNNDAYITLDELNDILKQYSDIGHAHSVEEIANLVLPTKLSQLQNDTSYVTEDYVTNAIANAQLGGDSQEPAELDVPRVYFYGDALPTTKDNVKLEMDYKSNTMKFHSYIKLKCQGTSSMNYVKKNFTVTMYEDSDRSVDLKKNFKGWGAQNKFCLKANWVDSTHTRNLSGARIAYDMVESRPDSPFKQELLKCPRNGAVDGFPIKVYFNGEFWGIYTWNIPKDAWMFNMNEDNPNHIVLCAERNTDGNSALINSCQFRQLWNGVDGDAGGDWSYEVGTPSDAVKNSLNRGISFVMNSSDQEFHDNISDYFDLYSLLDYYCFSYAACHLDGLAKNMLLATYDGVVWGACLYDMDSIYGVYWNGSSYVSPQYKCPEQYQEQFSRLWVRIEECFGEELRARYTELRQHALSLTNIVGHVEEIYDLLSPNMKTDETTKWPGIPQYNTNTMTRFRNYMRDRIKYTDAEIALIGAFIACESITLNKTELKMGIFNGEDGSAPEDDSNVNYIADAQWQAGCIDDTNGNINTGGVDKYCIIENLPIGLYTLHHDTFTYKRVCIRAYDESIETQGILTTSDYKGRPNVDDITFKISCSDTKVYIGLFPNGSEDYSGVTLKRQDLPESIYQDRLYNTSSLTQPGWDDLGDTANNLIVEIKLGSTTEITDITEIRTITIGDDIYNVCWSEKGMNVGSYVEKFPSRCVANTVYAGNWYVLLSLPTAKYGATVADFQTYCSNNDITHIVVNKSDAGTDSSGGTQLLTYTLRATALPTNTMDKVVWSVEPQGICTVSNGRVTAVNNGDCVITATCGQQRATCTVNVSGLSAQVFNKVFSIDSTCLNTEANTLIDKVSGISATITGAPTISDNKIVFTEADTFVANVTSLGLTNTTARTLRVKFTPTSLSSTFSNVAMIGNTAAEFSNADSIYVNNTELKIQWGMDKLIEGKTVGYDDTNTLNRLTGNPELNHEYEIILSQNSDGSLRYWVDGVLVQDGKMSPRNDWNYLCNTEGDCRLIGSYSLIEIYKQYFNEYPFGEQQLPADVLFELSEPIIGDGTESTPYIDTNIQLMSEENINNNWTILLECMGNTSGENVVVHCMWEDSGYPGLSIDYMMNNLRTVLPNNRIISAVPNCINFKTGVAIVKDGNTFTVYDKIGNVTDTAEVTPISHNNTLVIGAYKDTSGNYGRYLNGEIYNCRVSSEAYTTNQIIEYFNSSGTDLPLNELVYELNEPQVLDGSSKYVDTKIPLCGEDIDYTIFMNFKMNASGILQQSILHCMTETNPYPGINLQVSLTGIELSGASISPSIITSSDNKVLLSSQTTEVQPFVIRRQGSTIQIISKNGTGSATYTHYSTPQSLLLGAYQTSGGVLGRYANITINQAKVWTKALTDEELQSLING